MQMTVSPASVSRRACALAAVTLAVENACAVSCKALLKTAQVDEVQQLCMLQLLHAADWQFIAIACTSLTPPS